MEATRAPRRLWASVGVVVALAAVPCQAADAWSASDLALVNRLTWGATETDVREVARVGARRWLAKQLHPDADPVLPAAVEAQIDALPLVSKSMSQWVVDTDAQALAAKETADPEQRILGQAAYQKQLTDLANQAKARSILRDLYSPNQIQERMTWFWVNRFNVHQGKAVIRAMVGDYEDQAIRPRALGRFRDLLGATVKHPAMLLYLDNSDNAAGRINENYARELMELHTMGVGSGYTQKDVEELARILTGVGVYRRPEPPKLKPEHAADLVRDGLFIFNPDRHDYGDKVLLGHPIKGRGYAEVEEALDILSREPATARHVSEALATYFVSDKPPARLVDRMVARFMRSDGDIAQVLSTLFTSPEFKASLGGKFKDPAQYVLSAVRLAYGERPILNTSPIQGWMSRLGEGLYDRQTPDGYPLDGESWSGSGQIAVRFEIARQIGSTSAGLFKSAGSTSPEAAAFPQLQNALYFGGLGATLGRQSKQVLDQAVSPADWNTLFLSSPEFMRN